MKRSDIQQPAEGTLRRPSNTNLAVGGACAAAAVFGALNFAGTLLWGSMSAADIFSVVTIIAGVAGVAGSRAGAYVTVATMGINLALLVLFGMAIATGQTVETTAPDWLQLDVRVVLAFAALWCVVSLSTLVFGLWVASSGKR